MSQPLVRSCNKPVRVNVTVGLREDERDILGRAAFREGKQLATFIRESALYVASLQPKE